MRILVGYVTQLHSSGVDKYLLNVLRIAKEQGVALDFLTSQYNEDTKRQLSEYGCRLFTVHNLKDPSKHYRDVKAVLQSGEYDKAYFNISEPLNMMGAKAAHDLGIECIVHAHSSGADIANKLKRTVRTMINGMCRPFLSKYADCYVACSRKAAEWMYTRKALKSKRYHTIYNAIDVLAFSFDPGLGKSARKELGIGEDTVVVGHIGSYCYAKNNFFLVDIAKELEKTAPDSVMLCIGDGDHLQSVKDYAVSRGVQERMKFLGVKRNVTELLCAMNVFVLPSRFEGAPIAAIEAQMAGVPCIISDRVTDEVVISANTIQLPIDSPIPWAEAVASMSSREKVGIYPEMEKRYSLDRQKKQIIEILF